MSGIHEREKTLFCNQCGRQINKRTETTAVDGNVYCLHDGNWLCGEYDAFGDTEASAVSPAIVRIEMENQWLQQG